MILSDVVAIALSIIGFLMSLQGLWLVCRALWPARVEKAAQRCEHRRVASLFVGVLVTGVFFAVATVAGKALGAPGQLAAFVLLFFYIVIAGIGSAGFVTHIGRRLESPADIGRPWRATVRGGVALELACLIPVLGWFGILPLSLIVGAGAVTLTLFSGSNPQKIGEIEPASIEPESRGLRPANAPHGLAPLPNVPLANASLEMPAMQGQGVVR